MENWDPYLLNLAATLTELIRPELDRTKAKTVYVESHRTCNLDFYVAGDGGILGATSAGLATWIRQDIGKRWRGNGPAMLINTDLCEELAGIYTPAQFSIANEVACHELTHIVMRPELFRKATPCRAKQQFDRAAFSSVVESPVTEDQRNCHGPEFVRLVLHVAERMRRLGRTVNDSCLLDWESCCPARPMQCEMALTNEINGSIDRPLSEVAVLAMPAPFLDLWN